MKDKRILLLPLGLALIAIFIMSNISSNLFLSLTGTGFFIPTESNIIQFRPSIMNQGSGEWWLYAQDLNNYYALEDSFDEGFYNYIFIHRDNIPNGFNPIDKNTWGNAVEIGRVPR